jgi:lipopolysaccharide biosynthesis glycosyltransferase
VHLLLCTNALFLQHAAVCLTSLLLNNSDLCFDIVVVGRVTEELDEGKLRRSLVRFANHSLSFRRFTPPVGRLLPLNPRAHYTLDNWTRLWVEEFFDEAVDRVLYLDADTVVTGSIAELWGAELDGALFGAVDIPGADRGVELLGLRPEDGYFNSGVLLFDLKQWRESRALDTLLAYIDAHPHEMSFTLDQDALNGCFHDRRKHLDYRWNAVWTFFQDLPLPGLDRSACAAVRRDARIIHFNSSNKPWSYFCNHPRKGEYEKYLRMTEWRNFVPPDRTMVNRLRKLASIILPPPAKAGLKRIASLAIQSSRRVAR